MVAESTELSDLGAEVATSGFATKLGPAEQASWDKAQAALAEAGLAVPRLQELGLDNELVHALVRDGLVTRVSPDLLYLPSQIKEIMDGLPGLPEAFTVAQFRDHFGLTRKYAVPLVEWLDGEGVTVRDGDLRRIRSG